MKNVFKTAMTATLLISNLAQADCLPFYREKIKSIDSRLMSFKTTLATTAISEASLVGGLVLVAGTFSPAGVLVMPASMVGAGSYLGYLALQKKKYSKAFELIKAAKAGKLNKTGRKINHTLGVRLTNSDYINAIVEANKNNTFCVADEVTEKVKLVGYAKIVKYLKEEARAGNI